MPFVGGKWGASGSVPRKLASLAFCRGPAAAGALGLQGSGCSADQLSILRAAGAGVDGVPEATPAQ